LKGTYGSLMGIDSYDSIPRISDDPAILERIQASVDVLASHLKNGWYIYGVNTGFGGSADSRTDKVVALQAALMQLTQAGILNPIDIHGPDGGFDTGSHSMPAPWVRGTMLVRCNTNVRGHSAVSLNTLQAVVKLLENRLTPVIPLRGSVSASGDLMPLSYIAGAIEGSPDIFVEVSDSAGRERMSARDALQLKGLAPVTLGPKEGLGLVNDTAASAALASLVIYKAHQQAVLVQALTAMAVEAIQGSVESFDPFISAVRPHPGQAEVAHNMSTFLSGSRLTRAIRASKDRNKEDLIQDRYSLRSAPQWLGPQLEDLMLADRQITTELNSTSDNPLINTEGDGAILTGANFQAASITSAVEKIRLSLQMFGRLLISQLTEMVDPSLSFGLPANLASDDPSLSFTFKGVDIAMASYMAELSWLANPMSSHIQAAEMHNQSVNSMAFASARVSMQAAEVLSLMCANHLYACCQALDLRVLHNLFVGEVQVALKRLASTHFSSSLDQAGLEKLCTVIRDHVPANWKTTAKLDLKDRCAKLSSSLIPVLLEKLPAATTANTLQDFRKAAAEEAYKTWQAVSEGFKTKQPTEQYLGAATRVLYHFVRRDLGVPFHQGFVEHPTVDSDTLDGRPKKSVGGWISIVHAAICDGRWDDAFMAFVKE
jgi:phenylalanine ammonia-lyase